MTILSSDIKLRASERMTDTTDGGGRRTLNLIADGVAGNIFNKVSRVDSVYGRVNLRKVFGHVDTPGIDTYAGAHFIVTDAPDNNRIHVTAFSTASEYDTRTAARDRIESYVIAGPESRMVLYGRQLIGSQALLAYQRVEEPLPEIGEVYAVSTEVAGVTSAQQFVRIQDVEHEVRIFTDLLNNSIVEYTYRVLTMAIGAPLRYEFNGPSTPTAISGTGSFTGRLRSTTVADASRYFGIQPLVEAGAVSDLTLRVGSVYTPIVPTTQRETPLSLASIAGAANLVESFPTALLDGTANLATNNSAIYQCKRSPKKRSVSITINGPSAGYSPSTPAVDNGLGVIGASGDVGGSGVGIRITSGTVNYETGQINLVILGGPSPTAFSISVSYIPAVEVSQPAHTRAIEITLATRGTVYTPVLQPLPAPGTLLVDYRALGKWYRLRDDGTGEISGGDAAYGTGTVNYVTGGVIITLGALPDVGSSVLLSWGSPVHYEIRTNDAGSSAFQDFVLENLPVKENTFSFTYVSNGVTYTVSDNASGALSGGGVTGTVNYTTGEVSIEYGTLVPDFDSLLTVAYTSFIIDPVQPDPVIISGAPAIPGTLTIPGTPSTPYVPGQPYVPAQPGSEIFNLSKSFSEPSTTDFTFLFDPGMKPASFSADICVEVLSPQSNTSVSWTPGVLKVWSLANGNTLMGELSSLQGQTEWMRPGPASVVGTIDHATGTVQITAGNINVILKSWSFLLNNWNTAETNRPFHGRLGGANIYRYMAGRVVIPGTPEIPATDPIPATEGSPEIPGTPYVPATPDIVLQADSLATIDFNNVVTISVEDTAPIHLDITRTSTSDIVAGSLMFKAFGKTFIERSGTLYTDISPTTGSGLAAGSIDYSTGVATLSLWTRGAPLALTVQSCLIKFGEWDAVEAFFRTAGSPLRPASLYVQVTAEDGTLIMGLADQDGIINGTYMRGEVEQTMGVVWVQFGLLVTAAGNELEPWYDVANVVGSQVWKPKPVQPATLRYSAVVLSNLPLNADILGLDPVRLPSDGRVPIYRPADVVVIHNTLSYNAGTPAAGAVLNMGRTDLAALWLEDANKLKLSTTLYAANLVAGTVTMAADLSLTGYVTPIAVKHRIEEMGLLSDVQINGQITLTAPLLRAYPLGSFVSSALLFGDLFSRVTGVFDQNTWSGTWSNALIGSAATAQYNDIDYPIAVTNNAAVSDRWRINFTSSTAFQVVSENMGVISTGTTTVDLAPVNPLTGVPYFTLQSEGWGLGWAVGNQLRFNTVGAVAPVWLARTVLPGATLAGDSFDAQLRGDVD